MSVVGALALDLSGGGHVPQGVAKRIRPGSMHKPCTAGAFLHDRKMSCFIRRRRTFPAQNRRKGEYRMSAAIHPAQESGRRDALFDWVWKKDDLHYERERLARYRHAAGKALSGKHAGGWQPEKPSEDRTARSRRAIAGNRRGGRASHGAVCRMRQGRNGAFAAGGNHHRMQVRTIG